MLFRARGCVVALSLDAVEGVFESAVEPGSHEARLPDGTAVPLVDWSSLTDTPVADGEPDPTEAVVVATGAGAVGLAVERCLGTRRVSLAASRPIPTRLVDDRGAPACLLLRIDSRPIFLLEPRALAGAARLDLSPAAESGSAPQAPAAGASEGLEAHSR